MPNRLHCHPDGISAVTSDQVTRSSGTRRAKICSRVCPITGRMIHFWPPVETLGVGYRKGRGQISTTHVSTTISKMSSSGNVHRAISWVFASVFLQFWISQRTVYSLHDVIFGQTYHLAQRPNEKITLFQLVIRLSTKTLIISRFE